MFKALISFLKIESDVFYNCTGIHTFFNIETVTELRHHLVELNAMPHYTPEAIVSADIENWYNAMLTNQLIKYIHTIPDIYKRKGK